MVKYSSFILIASMFFLTVSCVSGSTENNTPPKVNALAKEILDGLTAFATDLTNLTGSSNVFVKMMLDMAESLISQYDKDKTQIQSAVTKATEMEKRIQSVLQSLKNSTIPLTKELQVEADEIGKHATSELTKLKGVSSVADIDGIKKGVKEKHDEIKGNMQELFRSFLSIVSTAGQTINITNETISAFKTKVIDLKTKLFAVIHKTVPVALAPKNNEDTISKKMKTTFTTLSEIRNDLDRVEQIQYNSLRSCKTHSASDSAFLTPLSFAPCAFAILLGILF